MIGGAIGNLVSASAKQYYDSSNPKNSSSETDRLFDFEHHTTNATTTSADFGGDTHALWGPTGHPFSIGSAGQTAENFDALHYDGDELLYTTSPSGQIDDIKFGHFADFTLPAGGFPIITFVDRDPSGLMLGCHNSSASGNVANIIGSLGDYYHSRQLCQGPSQDRHLPSYVGTPTFRGPSIGNGGILTEQRTDGFSDGINIYQGVRTFDETSGTWTTPDTFAGFAVDPSSQNGYEWNSNNPVAFSDPSGYTPENNSATGCPNSDPNCTALPNIGDVTVHPPPPPYPGLVPPPFTGFREPIFSPNTDELIAARSRRPRGHGNNQAENQTAHDAFRAVMKKLGKEPSKKNQQKAHKEITGQGHKGFDEVFKALYDFFSNEQH